jgi:hypothetical protein
MRLRILKVVGFLMAHDDPMGRVREELVTFCGQQSDMWETTSRIR